MAIQEVRQKLRKADIKQWEVADALGVSEFTLTRWLRKELSDERKAAVINTIHRLALQKKTRAGNRRT